MPDRPKVFCFLYLCFMVFSSYETGDDSPSRDWAVVSSAGGSMTSTDREADAIYDDDPGGKDTAEGSCEGWTAESGSSYAGRRVIWPCRF